LLDKPIAFFHSFVPRYHCVLWSPLSHEEVESRLSNSVTESFYWFTNEDTPFSGTVTPTGFRIGLHTWKDVPKPFMNGSIEQGQDGSRTQIRLSASYSFFEAAVTVLLWATIPSIFIQKYDLTDMSRLLLVYSLATAVALVWHWARLTFYWKQVNFVVNVLVSRLDAEISDCSHDQRRFAKPKRKTKGRTEGHP